MKKLTKTLIGTALLCTISGSAFAFPPMNYSSTGFNVLNTSTANVNAKITETNKPATGPNLIPQGAKVTYSNYGSGNYSSLTVVVGDTATPNGTCTLHSEGKTFPNSQLTLEKQSDGSQGFTCTINNNVFVLTKS